MSVSSVTLAIRYIGNGSTETAYQIPFPFLSPTHVYAAVASNGEADAELLSPGQYTVTRLNDCPGGWLTTAEPVSHPAEIVIFRSVPLTQPTEFQLQGPFPSVAAETALDRILMQVQQINRRVNQLEGVADEDYIFVPGGDPSLSVSVRVWQDVDDRPTTTPAAEGQLGVELETQTIWIAKSTMVGDWQEYNPRPIAGRLVLGVTADAGTPGSPQTAIAGLFSTWGVDAAIFAGDNAYNAASGYGGGYANDWAAFGSLISAGKAFPALGNHDLDSENWAAELAALFPYLPGNRRYYNKVLGGGLVELFVLNSGFNSIFDLVETDGNEVGSVQHAWFVNAVEASRARWKIAVFHHPPVTLATGENKFASEMAWPELAEMDLIICGHTHVHELVKWNDTMILNVSGASRTLGKLLGGLQGEGTATAWPLWANDDQRGCARVVATGTKLHVEVWNTGGSVLHARSYDDTQPVRAEREHYRITGPVEMFGSSVPYQITKIASPMMIRGVQLSCGGSMFDGANWTLSASIPVGDDVVEATVATGIWAKDTGSTAGASLIPLQMFPRGTSFEIMFNALTEIDPTELNGGLEVTLFVKRHS